VNRAGFRVERPAALADIKAIIERENNPAGNLTHDHLGIKYPFVSIEIGAVTVRKKVG